MLRISHTDIEQYYMFMVGATGVRTRQPSRVKQRRMVRKKATTKVQRRRKTSTRVVKRQINTLVWVPYKSINNFILCAIKIYYSIHIIKISSVIESRPWIMLIVFVLKSIVTNVSEKLISMFCIYKKHRKFNLWQLYALLYYAIY